MFSLRRASHAAVVLLAGAFSATGAAFGAETLFFEDFESVVLGPNLDEGLAGANVWTEVPPAGWSVDDSEMPLNGVREWNGWGFANKDWWVQTAGDQRRSEFTFGTGNVAIADPDEWDDKAHDEGKFNAHMTTPVIDIKNVADGSIILTFDSSWRPEGFDDGDGTNNQTAIIGVSFDGSPFDPWLYWDSDNNFEGTGTPGPLYHDHNPNEKVELNILQPPGAKTMQLRFDMLNAANDWWWAVDNIRVEGTVVPEPATGMLAVSALLSTFLLRRRSN